MGGPPMGLGGPPMGLGGPPIGMGGPPMGGPSPDGGAPQAAVKIRKVDEKDLWSIWEKEQKKSRQK